MTGSIFLIQADDKLVEMNEQMYDSEDLLQTLLAKYPNLLAGDQINSSQPRRWLLIKREMSVPGETDGAGRWSLDHLFLDQDAIPTLVEVKRSSDTRIRREVIGQMLDYAANGVAYWSAEAMRVAFESDCLSRGSDAEQELRDFLDSEIDVDAFWQEAKTNLEKGRVRMVFVADLIPKELQRIVEFLNEQMDRAEVLAVEIKQFAGFGMKTLVPKVIGQTAAAQVKKTGTNRPEKQWDDVSFFETMAAERPAEEVTVARHLLDWAKQTVPILSWGKGGQSGSFMVSFEHDGFKHNLLSVWTYGRLETQFKRLGREGVFVDEAKRRELQRRLNAITGVSIPDEGLTKRPSIALSALADEAALKQFQATMEWVMNEVKGS